MKQSLSGPLFLGEIPMVLWSQCLMLPPSRSELWGVNHLPGVPPSSKTFGCKMSVVLTMKVSENVVPKSSKMSPWQYWNPWWLGDLGPRLGDPQWLKNPLDPNWVIIPQNWSFEGGKWLAMRCLLSCALLLFYPAQTIHEACAHDCQCIFTWENIMCFWTGYIGNI